MTIYVNWQHLNSAQEEALKAALSLLRFRVDSEPFPTGIEIEYKERCEEVLQFMYRVQ